LIVDCVSLIFLILNTDKTWQFVVYSLITNCCYKLLEKQNVTKNKVVRDIIFQILGVMVKRFNHTIGTPVIFLLTK